MARMELWCRLILDGTIPASENPVRRCLVTACRPHSAYALLL